MLNEIPLRLYKYRAFNARALDMLVADQVYFADPRTFNDPLDVQPVVKADLSIDDLEKVLNQLIHNRVMAEKRSAAKLISTKSQKMRAHIDKISKLEARRQIEEIRNYAGFWGEPENRPDPEISAFEIEMAKELRARYGKGIFSLSEKPDCPVMWSHYGDEHRGICVGYSVPGNSRCDLQEVRYDGSREVAASMIKAMLDCDPNARQHVDRAVLLRKAKGWEYEKEWRLIGSRGSTGSPLEMEEVILWYAL